MGVHLRGRMDETDSVFIITIGLGMGKERERVLMSESQLTVVLYHVRV